MIKIEILKTKFYYITIILLLLSSVYCYGQITPKIDVDKNGNINLVGDFRDSLVFSNSPTIHSTVGFWLWDESFLIQMDSTGQVKWYKLFGWADFTDIDVVSDNIGNIYMAGEFTGACTLDSITTLTDSLGKIIVVKYNPTGKLIWARQSIGYSTNSSFDIGIDSSSNVYITGVFNGQITFGYNDTLNSAQTNTFIAKFDSSGNNLWMAQISGTTVMAFDIEVDEVGNSYVTGEFLFNTPIYFGNDSIISNGIFDAYVAKCSPNGTPLWIKNLGGSESDIGTDIGVSKNGIATMIGNFRDTVYFQALPPLISNPPLARSLFIANYDSSGNENWAFKGEPSNSAYIDRVSIDNTGNIFISGYSSVTYIDINGTPINGGSQNNSYLIKMDSSGQVICGSYIAKGIGRDIDIDDNNDVYITGLFIDSIDFNGFQTNYGSSLNFYIAKFDQNCNLLWTNIIESYVIGIENQTKKEFWVNIFPNPTSSTFTIKGNYTLPAVLELYDISGRQVQKQSLSSYQQQVDVSKLARGMYVWNLGEARGKLVVE